MDNWIWNQLNCSNQVLSRNLLHDSHTMPHAVYIFISTSYEYTMNSGKFDSTQAWEITSSFFKIIFSEIGYAKVHARDIIIIDAPWSSGAGILFATLHAYSIMSEFECLSIKDHPSISSDMVKFVYYSIP